MQVCFTLSQKNNFGLNLFKMQREAFFPPQQARRSTDYKLRFEHRHLCETRRMLKLFCKLCTRMLLSSLSIPTSSSYGKTHPFQCWQYHQCGWMYQRMRRGWFYACGTEVFREILIKVPFLSGIANSATVAMLNHQQSSK